MVVAENNTDKTKIQVHYCVYAAKKKKKKFIYSFNIFVPSGIRFFNDGTFCSVNALRGN